MARKRQPITRAAYPRKYDFKEGDRVGKLRICAPLTGGYYACVCDCGTKVETRGAHLAQGKTTSCGCARAGLPIKRHGKTRTPEYQILKAAIRRCTKSTDRSWADYGGRGIRVCDRWRFGETVAGVWTPGIDVFLADVGPRPSSSHTLGRIDNDGNYEPGNVAWETRQAQSRNTRANRYFTVDGKRRCVSDWEKQAGVGNGVIHARLKRGWPVDLACTAPPATASTHHTHKKELKTRDARINELEATVAAKDAEITELEASNAELKATIARLTAGQ